MPKNIKDTAVDVTLSTKLKIRNIAKDAGLPLGRTIELLCAREILLGGRLVDGGSR